MIFHSQRRPHSNNSLAGNNCNTGFSPINRFNFKMTPDFDAAYMVPILAYNLLIIRSQGLHFSISHIPF